jgi:predicted tellurium resistance membrane protein TerC
MTEFLDIAISLFTLTILEIVLGIDNLVFLAILANRLPQHQRKRARHLGLTMAWVTRLLLLSSALFLTKMTHPLVTILDHPFSIRDVFLLAGGIFLIYKATQEIHGEMTPPTSKKDPQFKANQFIMIVIQIAILDIVFSLDSVLTAIGLTNRFWLMSVAITIAILTMIFVSEALSRFIDNNPTIKMLALSFLFLIGTVLIADGFQVHIPRAYIYVAISFSLMIEALNIVKKNRLSRPKK